MDNRIPVSENFSLHEFECRCKARGYFEKEPGVYCGGVAIAHPELVSKLQQLRNFFGRKITITSGYRCPAYNKRPRNAGGVGGAAKSWHMTGRAADIIVEGVKPARVAEVADMLGFVGIKAYHTDGFTHVDVRTGERWRG